MTPRPTGHKYEGLLFDLRWDAHPECMIYHALTNALPSPSGGPVLMLQAVQPRWYVPREQQIERMAREVRRLLARELAGGS